MSYFDTNFSFDLPQIPQPQIPQPQQTMDDLPNLLKHPCVMDLYRQNQALQSSQIKLQEIAEKSFALQDKNLTLQNRLLSVESELSEAKQKVNSLTAELQILQANSIL